MPGGGSSRFTDVPFSRIWDKFGNDVTYEGNAPDGNTIWGVRVPPPYMSRAARRCTTAAEESCTARTMRKN